MRRCFIFLFVGTAKFSRIPFEPRELYKQPADGYPTLTRLATDFDLNKEEPLMVISSIKNLYLMLIYDVDFPSRLHPPKQP